MTKYSSLSLPLSLSLFTLIITLFSSSVFSQKAELKASKDAKSVAQALFPFAFKEGKGPLKTDGCKIQKEKWTMLMVTREPFKQTFKFSTNCDLQGSFLVQIDKFFPIDLKLKNFSDYKSISGKIKLGLTMDKGPVLNIDIKNALLVGAQKKIPFEMVYKAIIDPFNKKNIIKEQKEFSLKIK